MYKYPQFLKQTKKKIQPLTYRVDECLDKRNTVIFHNVIFDELLSSDSLRKFGTFIITFPCDVACFFSQWEPAVADLIGTTYPLTDFVHRPNQFHADSVGVLAAVPDVRDEYHGAVHLSVRM